MLIKNSRIYFWILLAFTSCIDPVEMHLEPQPEQLVVEGLLTNEAVQAPIKLSYTQRYTKEIGNVARKARYATVYVTDQNNTRYNYYENEPGNYIPESFTGTIGNTYTLHIITEDKKEYLSAPEKMLPTSPVDGLSAELRSRQVINPAGIEVTEYAFQTFVNTSDPADEKNFYMWRWIGTYEVHTQPQDHTRDVQGTPVPDPLPCCAICWVTEGHQNISVRNDALVNGNKIIKQPIAYLPVLPENFNFKYHLQVKQYSLSESAFNFWRILTSQVTGVGSVQDPPPASIPGNIRNINDENETVMGYFGASAVSTNTLFINRTEFPFAISRYIYADDCRTLKNSTATKPDFW
ncbi:DUF4249 domain-containing protein [Adhaeribacter swui]|uniref:DUF4249 domain-containing protein n=1 Tax=Adhaeribacter swui TaxID=2086471 RepID=A0A7G7GCP2_9BACT|nr:DUF4249 domain-containing protein [Adhaeribacter swui]QNF34926.1 DUF4249 domain-containing protein [Adhaeribacter swui]